jgi:hypothetical protein
MIYTWRCATCKEKVDVSRSLDDYMIGPHPTEHTCTEGDGITFTRVITNPRSVRVVEYEDTETGRWPI